jgi:small subunit ribosomal protein S20
MIVVFQGDTMANHPSAIKRHRQSLKKRALNQTNRHKLKTQMKKLKTVIASGKQDDAKALLPVTFGLIDRSVQKGVIKENTARRYKSRLAKSVNGLTAAASV